MDEKKLRELTRKTAERLFGNAGKGTGAYAQEICFRLLHLIALPPGFALADEILR